MSWTAPRTWVTAEIVTASQMNTHVRDNLRYLKGLSGPVAIGDVLTSTTFVTTASAGIRRDVDNSYILLQGGATGYPATVQLYGEDDGSYPATLNLLIANSAKSAYITACSISGATDTPGIAWSASARHSTMYFADGAAITPANDNTYLTVRGGPTNGPKIEMTGKDQAFSGDIRFYVTDTAKAGLVTTLIMGPGDNPLLTWSTAARHTTIYMADNYALRPGSTNNLLSLIGGGSGNNSAIRLYGGTHATYPSRIGFWTKTSGAAEQEVAYITGNTDTPVVALNFGIVTAADILAKHADDSSIVWVYGGNTLATSPSIALYGASHAGVPGNIILSVWDGAVSTKTALTLDTAGDATFGNNIVLAAGKTVDGVDPSDGSTYAAHGIGQHTDRANTKLIPAHACYSTTAAQAIEGTAKSYWLCADNEDDKVLAHDYADERYVSGYKIYAVWQSAAAAGDIYMNLYISYGTDNEIESNSAGTVEAITTNGANKYNYSALASGPTYTNIAIGDMINIEFQRDATNVLDTLGADVKFFGFLVEFTRDQ